MRAASVLRAVGALALILASPARAGAACTREEAFDRMMALNQYGMKLQAAMPDPLKDPAGYDAKFPRVTDFNSRLAAVGKTLAAQDYDAACASYAALAGEYHVDLARQGVRPLSALEAEAKNPPKNACDLAESSRRSMRLTEAFQRRAHAEKLGRDDWQRFGKDTGQVGLLMQRDPEAACTLIDALAAKYRVQL